MITNTIPGVAAPGSEGGAETSASHKHGGGAPPSSTIGHNSVTADQLRAFVERIEKLEEEKANLAGDIREIYSEAKSNGYDVKILRRVISLRKKDFAKRQEEEAILEVYMNALGMLADTPLGQAAVARNFARPA